MAPPHVYMLLDQLPSYFDSSVSIELLDRLRIQQYKTQTRCHAMEISIGRREMDDECCAYNKSRTSKLEPKDFLDIPLISQAIREPALSDLIYDIIREVETWRSKAGVFDQYDNWQYLSRKLNINNFLTFIYALLCIGEYDPIETIHRKLALGAARLYIVLLCTPGQKQTTAYNEHVLSKSLEVFKIVDLLGTIDRIPTTNARILLSSETHRLLLDYILLMDDLQLLFRCMSLKNCELIKQQVISTTKHLLIFCVKNALNYTVTLQLADKIFTTLSLMCFPEHDDHSDSSTTINMILNRTAIFYTLEYKNVPPAFQLYNFLIKLLEQNPEDTSRILTNFIKSVITNPPKMFSLPEDHDHLLDVAVKYELAMFSKCNISIIEYLKKIETHAETAVRINMLELLAKLAVEDCHVDWELFQSDISKIPREIDMIKILYNKLIEKSNIVKQKAFQCLLRMLQNGNNIIKQIFHDVFYCPYVDEDENNYLQMNDAEELYLTAEHELGISRNYLINQNNLNIKKLQNDIMQRETLENKWPTVESQFPNVEGLDTIHGILKTLPNIIYEATLSSISAIRRVALLCLACILELNRNLIEDRVVENIIVKLAKDQVMLVRRTTLTVMNKLIGKYPNYLPCVKLWSKCLLFFLDDVDQKLKQSAMESLKANVFDSICRFEDSATGKLFTPWMIVRSILILGKINVLRSAVESWIAKSILTQRNLSIIESHIFTVNCSEAWIIMSIIACKMKSRNPDVIIKLMSDILQQDMYNSPICLQYILSVIKSWLEDFSRAGLNHLFKILSDLLRTGSTNISLVSDIYSLCCMIKEKSDGIVDSNWIANMRNSSAEYLLHYHSHYASMHMTNERYLISLLVYSESVTDLNDKPNAQILNILQKYISFIASNENLLRLQTDQHRKINVSIIVLARFSIRDGSLAASIIPEFNKILKFKNLNESIICTLITAFSDLCKRHTSLVDSSITTVIGQLSSNYVNVRSVALNNLNELILQDYVKMRGGVLLNILKLIIDENNDIAAQALYVIQSYVHSRNEKLLIVSFLECVYVFNNYLQFAESNMFPASEIANAPCDFAGNEEESFRKRSAIYDFFAENIDDNSLLKLLKNVNKIHHQLANKLYVECSQGVSTLIDLLYIFKLMCNASDRDKIQTVKISGTDDNDYSAKPEEGQPATKRTRTKTDPWQKEHESMAIVEKMIRIYYDFQQEVLKYVYKIEPERIDITTQRLRDLGIAVASNFRGSVEFAKPVSFWKSLTDSADDLLKCK